MVQCADYYHRGCVNRSPNPARFTIKAPLLRKARGNHFIKSTSLESLKALYLASVKFQIKDVVQFNFRLFLTRKLLSTCLVLHFDVNRPHESK